MMNRKPVFLFCPAWDQDRTQSADPRQSMCSRLARACARAGIVGDFGNITANLFYSTVLGGVAKLIVLNR